MALERDAIISAALRLLDEAGLEKLTLRRLAAELGVQAPALYWHFRNKQELLDAMADAVTVREAPAPRPLADGESWETWLGDLIRGQRRVITSHRDMARLAAGTRPGQGTLAAAEVVLESLRRAGFDLAEAVWGVGALNSFLGGFVLEEQADRERAVSDDGRSENPPEALAPYFPTLHAAVIATGGVQGDEAFEHGLSLIITGMRARLAEKSGSQEGDDDISVEGVRPAAD